MAGQQNVALNQPFAVQLLCLGMIFADPEYLKRVVPEDFCDEELRILISSLQAKELDVSDKRNKISQFLSGIGVKWTPDPPNKSSRPDMAIVETLKLDSQCNRVSNIIQDLLRLMDQGDRNAKELFVKGFVDASDILL